VANERLGLFLLKRSEQNNCDLRKIIYTSSASSMIGSGPKERGTDDCGTATSFMAPDRLLHCVHKDLWCHRCICERFSLAHFK